MAHGIVRVKSGDTTQRGVTPERSHGKEPWAESRAARSRGTARAEGVSCARGRARGPCAWSGFRAPREGRARFSAREEEQARVRALCAEKSARGWLSRAAEWTARVSRAPDGEARGGEGERRASGCEAAWRELVRAPRVRSAAASCSSFLARSEGGLGNFRNSSGVDKQERGGERELGVFLLLLFGVWPMTRGRRRRSWRSAEVLETEMEGREGESER